MTYNVGPGKNDSSVGGHFTSMTMVYDTYNYPYGSKHCLRRYLTLQIIVNYTPNTS